MILNDARKIEDIQESIILVISKQKLDVDQMKKLENACLTCLKLSKEFSES